MIDLEYKSKSSLGYHTNMHNGGAIGAGQVFPVNFNNNKMRFKKNSSDLEELVIP
jgi:hypothetical protein